MIIDAHTHLGNFNNKSFSPEDLIQSMDEAAIQYSFVIAEKTTVSPKRLSTEEATPASFIQLFPFRSKPHWKPHAYRCNVLCWEGKDRWNGKNTRAF